MFESLRLRVTFWAGERVRKREVGAFEELVVLGVRALGVFGMGARMAGMGGRGLLILVVVVVGVAARVDLVTRLVLVAVETEADLVTLPVLAMGMGVGVSGSGVVGDAVRPASFADLVIMRDTKVSSCSSMDPVAVLVLVWLLSAPVSRG